MFFSFSLHCILRSVLYSTHVRFRFLSEQHRTRIYLGRMKRKEGDFHGNEKESRQETNEEDDEEEGNEGEESRS